jgi:hypothetical protein
MFGGVEWLGTGGQTLRVGAEMVYETSVIFNQLKRQVARGFINFCRRKDWRSYKVTLHGEVSLSKVKLLGPKVGVGRFLRNVGKYLPG